MNPLSKTVNKATEADSNAEYDGMVAILHGQLEGASVEALQEFFEDAAEDGNADAYLQLAEMQHKRMTPDYSKKKNIGHLVKALKSNDERVQAVAYDKLNDMRDRIVDRDTLRANEEATSTSSGDVQSFAYAQEKAEQDDELYPTINKAIVDYDAGINPSHNVGICHEN